MRRAMTQRLMATSAATLLGVLLAMPASAQGQDRQDRQGRGGMQAGENMRGGGEMRGGNQGQFRGNAQGEVRGGRAERGAQVRGRASTEGTIGRRDNLQRQTRVRSDARVRADSNVRIRGDNNLRIRDDSNIRTSFRDDRRFRDRRFLDRGTSVNIGVGFSDPYYDDGYYAYGAAAPYGYRRPFVGAYEGYAAAPGCTCAPGAYGASAATYNWGWGSSWDRGGW